MFYTYYLVGLVVCSRSEVAAVAPVPAAVAAEVDAVQSIRILHPDKAHCSRPCRTFFHSNNL